MTSLQPNARSRPNGGGRVSPKPHRSRGTYLMMLVQSSSVWGRSYRSRRR